ncbi:MAG: hypothetical protein WD872_16505 [Pirellulaceae bacterium]
MSNSEKLRTVPSSIASGSYLAAALAVLLTVEIVGLIVYGNYRVQTALAPENLADRAEAAIRENYPEFRKELVTQVREQAPEIAEQVSHELVSSAPAARERLERFTARQLAAGLDTATELSAEQFREILNANHEQLAQAFEQIEAAPEEAREIVLSTEASIEQQLGVDLQKQAKAVVGVHRQLNDKLELLADPNAKLQPRELLERRIVRILRAMQTREPASARLAESPLEDVTR